VSAHRRQHPVYLLRDRAGVYGLGCAIEWKKKPARLILRPDLIRASLNLPNVEIKKTDLVRGDDSYSVALQPIHSSMNPRGLVEEEFRRIVHRELLRRRGLDYFNCERPSQGNGWDWWAHFPREQARNRKIYHATKGSSFAIVNELIRKALRAAADPAALKLARRFHVNHRYCIYCAAVCSQRAAQLAETFPLLMAAIYTGIGDQLDEVSESQQEEAAKMVEAGASLKRIAEIMNIPMALRRVPPGAASLAHDGVSEICARNPKLFETYLPKKLRQARRWLRAIVDASYRCDDDDEKLVEWVARHCLEIPGKHYDALDTLSDILDWARAEATVRPFCPGMSLRTVTRLSASGTRQLPTPRLAPTTNSRSHGAQPVKHTVTKSSRSRARASCTARAGPCITAWRPTPTASLPGAAISTLSADRAVASAWPR
jgi:hypothetical protein